mmetsp:Transcript_28174/g.77580  ORF Transcript_28174/g.77580 Transcript_28174/m.77580 type:complete len:224 (-) Transcript_28174:1034-1705(-)
MLKLILPSTVSTESTRTDTSWPISSSFSTLSTKPSLICVMCTSPSAEAAPSSEVTVTKAPKDATLATFAFSHWSDETPSKAERSAGPRRVIPPPLPPARIERLILPRSRSTERILTCTSWPTSTSSSTFSTKPSSLSCEMCTRPSAAGPPSGRATVTKAPKCRTPETVPLCHSSGDSSEKGVRSVRGRAPLVPSTMPSTMVRPNLPSSLRPLTQTSTSWPSSR